MKFLPWPQFIGAGGPRSPSHNVCLISLKAVSTAPNCNPCKGKGWGGDDVCHSPVANTFPGRLYAFKGLAGINLFPQVAIVLELALVPSQGSAPRSSQFLHRSVIEPRPSKYRDQGPLNSSTQLPTTSDCTSSIHAGYHESGREHIFISRGCTGSKPRRSQVPNAGQEGGRISPNSSNEAKIFPQPRLGSLQSVETLGLSSI
jgi:hypothetical protein